MVGFGHRVGFLSEHVGHVVYPWQQRGRGHADPLLRLVDPAVPVTGYLHAVYDVRS